MKRTKNDYFQLKGLGVAELNLTGEHPLYVYRNNKFEWVQVKDLTTDDYFTFNINQQNIDVNLTNEELWLLGRYVADGFINKYHNYSVEFAIGFEKEEEFLNNIPKEFVSKFKKFKKSCWDYRIANKKFQSLCKQFGVGAKNKIIPQWVIDLPIDKLQSFFNGYISGDGHIRKDRKTQTIMWSTTSENLHLGLSQIVAKIYKIIPTVSIRKDNRKETFNDVYNCQFSLANTHREQFVIQDKIITRIKKITLFKKVVEVYNFEVEKDNSYTCNNIIVHNCQDISVAGKANGFEKGTGTRSGLLWEVERLLNECKELPQILVMENVDAILNSRNIDNFKLWLNYLDSKGYTSKYQVLNATDYGIPQHRKRCFCVSWLSGEGNEFYYNFPTPKPLNWCLQDFLEKEPVEDKYYLPENYNIGEFEMEEIENIRIRKLTPKECYRLMGFCPIKSSQEFDDSNFERASKVVSNSQLYKQAGNSIVVDVLEAIFKEMC